MRGRKPGYKHNQATKDKISDSMSGKHKSDAHKDALAASQRNTARKCALRLQEMRLEYPECVDFFDNNKTKLLIAMRDIKSNKELRDIRSYIETKHLEDVPQAYLSYQYDSSSFYAQEDAMIELIDTANFLRKFEALDLAKSVLTH